MDSSSRAESERSVTSARGSFPSGWRSAVFGRTCGSTANPDDRRCGTRTLPTAPVAPATKTVITGASVYTIEGLRTRRRPAEGERRRSPGQARNHAESLKLHASRGVLEEHAATSDPLRLAQRLRLERRMLGVEAQKIEHRSGIARAPEHGVEEDDVERAVRLLPQPRAMLRVDDLDGAAGLAAGVSKATQRCLRECGDGGVALQADDPPSGSVRGDERISAEPEGGVEDGLAWTKARVRDDRIHLAPGGAQHAQNRHASARAEYAAALVEIRAARGEHQHGCSGRTGENRGKRSARTRLGLQPEARGQLPGLGGIAAPRGGDDGLHGASVPPRIRWDVGDERFLSDVLDFERWLP